MSDTSTGDPGKPMEQSNNNLSEAMEQLSVTIKNSEKKSPSLSDMPVDVVGLIIERSNYKQQLKLRKVSKSLRVLIDRKTPACKTLKLDYRGGKVVITFNNQKVDYSNSSYKLCCGDVRTTVKSKEFKKVAFDDLASTLINPKLKLENFIISDSTFFETKYIDEYYNNIRRVFESLNHQVSVKEIELRVASPSCLLSILPYLKPGLLEKIKLHPHTRGRASWRIDSSSMDQVARLEQWKQAEELDLRYLLHWFPLKYATHFKRFQLYERYPSEDIFIRIREYLSKLQNFEQCILSSSDFLYMPDLVHQVLGVPVSSNITEEIFQYSIPDSDYYFELSWPKRTEDVKIVKKKRESN